MSKYWFAIEDDGNNDIFFRLCWHFFWASTASARWPTFFEGLEAWASETKSSLCYLPSLWPFNYDDVIKKVVATKTFWPLKNIIKETFVTSQLWRLPCTKSAFFCQFEAFKGRIQWFSLHRKLQCSTAVKRTLPPWNLVDYSSQEIHFCGQKTGIKSASPSVRHRPRNQSSKKDFTILSTVRRVPVDKALDTENTSILS